MSTTPNDPSRAAELERFRRSWKAEIQREIALKGRRGGYPPASVGHEEQSTSSPSLTSVQQIETKLESLALGPGNRAVDIYKRAVNAEDEGQYDLALKLYREAFRLDPSVDRRFAEQEDALQQLSVLPDSPKAPKQVSPTIKETPKPRVNVIASSLVKILDGFPAVLDFVADTEGESNTTPLSLLPDELILTVLKFVDHTTLERFATSCRKARVLSCEPSLWRTYVRDAYCSSMLPASANVESLAQQFKLDWRQLYVAHPRIRLDGVYIATCRYVRPGISENVWVDVQHLITYYRFLRFFPNGIVLSLLSNEDRDRPPKELIHSLQFDLRMKGLFFGHWRLDGQQVVVTDLTDASSKTSLPPIVDRVSRYGADSPSPYSFVMNLTIKSVPLGRWNRLHLTSYSSVDSRNGDVVPLSLARENDETKSRDTGFWFSRVKSWGQY